MPDSSLTDVSSACQQIASGSHARRLIRVGYAPDAVRGMFCLQPTDALWDEVQRYHDERKAHGSGEVQASPDPQEDSNQQ